MRMTVIVEKEKVVAAQQGHSGDYGRGAGLLAGPGQSLQEVDVPDEAVDPTQPERFEREIDRLVKKK